MIEKTLKKITEKNSFSFLSLSLSLSFLKKNLHFFFYLLLESASSLSHLAACVA